MAMWLIYSAIEAHREALLIVQHEVATATETVTPLSSHTGASQSRQPIDSLASIVESGESRMSSSASSAEDHMAISLSTMPVPKSTRRRSTSHVEAPSLGSSSIVNPMMAARSLESHTTSRDSARAAVSSIGSNGGSLFLHNLQRGLRADDDRHAAIVDAKNIWLRFSPDEKDLRKKRKIVCGLEVTYTLSFRAIAAGLFHGLLAPAFRYLNLIDLCEHELEVYFHATCAGASNATCGVFRRPAPSEVQAARISGPNGDGCAEFATVDDSVVTPVQVMMGGTSTLHVLLSAFTVVATTYLTYKLFRMLGHVVSEFRARERLMRMLNKHFVGQPTKNKTLSMTTIRGAVTQAMSTRFDVSSSTTSTVGRGEDGFAKLDFANDGDRAFRIAVVLRACVVRAAKCAILSQGLVPFAYFLVGLCIALGQLLWTIVFSGQKFVIRTSQVMLFCDSTLILVVGLLAIYYSLRSNQAQRRHGSVFFQHKLHVVHQIQQLELQASGLRATGLESPTVTGSGGSQASSTGASGVGANVTEQLMRLTHLRDNLDDYVYELKEWDEPSRFYGLRIDASLLGKAAIAGVAALFSQGSLFSAELLQPVFPIVRPNSGA